MKKNRKWLLTEEKFLIENYRIYGILYCSKKLNRSIFSVRNHVHQLSLGKNTPHRRWTEEDINFLKNNYKNIGIPECAEKLKRTYAAVNNCAYRFNLTDRKNANKLRRKYKQIGDLTSTYWAIVVNNAKITNRKLEITIEYAWDIFKKQKGFCALSGRRIYFAKSFSEKHRKDQTASLDRINSKKDYVEGNVQWLHKDINLIKQAFNDKYFIQTCKEITEYQNNK